MSEMLAPFSGFVNPLLGSTWNDNSIHMKGQKKTPKVPGFMRVVLGQNVRKLMDRHYKESGNKPKALAKDAVLSLSTVQRILAHQTGASLDNIEALAAVFDLSAYQILLADLDIENPQVVRGAAKNEERMYRNWKRTKSAPVAPELVKGNG